VLARPIANEEEGIKTSSVISVESVRELRARLSSRPVLAPRRVAFLPEAERLNDEGANALLKCLEEPPAGAVFVMAARDASRLPATILSRAITLTLGPVSSSVIEAWLEARGVSVSERQEAARQALGRPGYALRWVEDADERVRAADAARQVDAALSAFDAGAAMAAFSEGARMIESSDDPRAAWDAHLDLLMRALRDHFAEKPRESLALGHALAEARRANGGPVSPRIWMEINLLRSFTHGPQFPQHIRSIV
jgi:replication-associated recombination protein RarA